MSELSLSTRLNNRNQNPALIDEVAGMEARIADLSERLCDAQSALAFEREARERAETERDELNALLGELE